MRNTILIFLVAVLGAFAATAQSTVDGRSAGQKRPELTLGYNFTRANAPPGSCDCFNMQGGFAGADYLVGKWRMGVTGQFTGSHASRISTLGQDLSLMTFKAGPRFFWMHDRYTPYAEFLLGAAHGSGSYFPTGSTSSSSATSFVYSPGAGLDIQVTRRLAVRAVDVEYLHTGFPNGSSNAQHQLQIQAGVVFYLHE